MANKNKKFTILSVEVNECRVLGMSGAPGSLLTYLPPTTSAQTGASKVENRELSQIRDKPEGHREGERGGSSQSKLTYRNTDPRGQVGGKS